MRLYFMIIWNDTLKFFSVNDHCCIKYILKQKNLPHKFMYEIISQPVPLSV